MVMLAIRAAGKGPIPISRPTLPLIDENRRYLVTEYQTFVVSIPVWEIVENFMTPIIWKKGGGDQLADLMSYIDYYGDVSPLSMY
jgi:hypothetical protein